MAKIMNKDQTSFHESGMACFIKMHLLLVMATMIYIETAKSVIPWSYWPSKVFLQNDAKEIKGLFRTRHQIQITSYKGLVQEP